MQQQHIKIIFDSVKKKFTRKATDFPVVFMTIYKFRKENGVKMIIPVDYYTPTDKYVQGFLFLGRPIEVDNETTIGQCYLTCERDPNSQWKYKYNDSAEIMKKHEANLRNYMGQTEIEIKSILTTWIESKGAKEMGIGLQIFFDNCINEITQKDILKIFTEHLVKYDFESAFFLKSKRIIMFLDITNGAELTDLPIGSTMLAYSSLINELVRCIRQTRISNVNIKIENFLGDGLFVSFTLDKESLDDNTINEIKEDIIECAITLIETFKKIMDSWRKSNIHLRISLDYGDTQQIKIDSGDEEIPVREYSFGRSVNQAAVLADHLPRKASCIAVTNAYYANLSDGYKNKYELTCWSDLHNTYLRCSERAHCNQICKYLDDEKKINRYELRRIYMRKL